MRHVVVHSMGELIREIKKDLKQKDRALDRAAKRAARRTAQYMAGAARREVPVAFGDLRDSIHAVGTKVIIDAPHAAAVENGSRPHWPPLEPLIKWVKLRGFQGLIALDRGSSMLDKLPGPTTAAHAINTALSLRHHMAQGADEEQAARRIAGAIAAHIAKFGTKPTHFVAKQIPRARAFLAEEVEAALATAAE